MADKAVSGEEKTMIPKPKPFHIFCLVLIVVITIIFSLYLAGVRLPEYHPPPPKTYTCPECGWNGTKANMTELTDERMEPRIYTVYNPATETWETRIGLWLITIHTFKCPMCGEVLDEYETRTPI